ncbi:flagellar motor protein MotB [Marinilactibacillus psychrotolerans]|uniref:Flagellar motor protein MotB n=1 Tax=Marinilactibacillus psychrotolerans TaxID=191770 RepID=A0AAV3WQR1_9LACT|nr:flagellar motor protein MotB [Marinilactibacillus psychrotolerans]GEL66217.1 chemotaxis protein MotB [Marinilactibacillus psychrotolerans]GEQ35040.1 flagellar motor protein MotB [Marinilactibacillus psychrotolerans]SDC26842.1 chemotaxis protein MotB [Marinilactibacillus psychrotolerans]
MARKPKKAKSSGAPAWMATYSDLMSLLLTFFVLLFSMSSVSEEQFKAVAESLRVALAGSSNDSILEDNGSTISDLNTTEVEDIDQANPEDLTVEDSESVESTNVIPQEVQELYETANKYMAENGIESDLTISRDTEGVYIDIQESILFTSGNADITASGEETLSKLSGLFDLFDNKIVVEGYTDNVPINNSKFSSNWELSTGRAVSVLRYLSEERGVSPNRLAAKGYGEHSPQVANDSDENRALNRRVNVIIMYEDREEVDNGE